MTEQLTELKGHIKEVQYTTHHIERHATCSGNEVITFTQYCKRKGSGKCVDSTPFYSHHHGYKFRLKIKYYSSNCNDIGAFLHLMDGEYDDELPWPVKVKVQLELLNQAGDHHHLVISREMKWKNDAEQDIDVSF